MGSRDIKLEQWKVCVEAANRLETRRDGHNKLFVTIFSSVVGACCYSLQHFRTYPALRIVTAAGLFFCCILCVAWHFLLEEFRSLASAKFKVIFKLEEVISPDLKPMSDEWQIVKRGREGLSSLITRLQKRLPQMFGLAFSILFVFTLFSP